METEKKVLLELIESIEDENAIEHLLDFIKEFKEYYEV